MSSRARICALTGVALFFFFSELPDWTAYLRFEGQTPTLNAWYAVGGTTYRWSVHLAPFAFAAGIALSRRWRRPAAAWFLFGALGDHAWDAFMGVLFVARSFAAGLLDSTPQAAEHLAYAVDIGIGLAVVVFAWSRWRRLPPPRTVFEWSHTNAVVFAGAIATVLLRVAPWLIYGKVTARARLDLAYDAHRTLGIVIGILAPVLVAASIAWLNGADTKNHTPPSATA
jgi:hypothetical protein